MDLLITGLIVLLVLILFLKGRKRTPRRAHTGPSRSGERLSAPTRPFFSRHGKDDWRYWRDLAITLALGIAFVAGLMVLAARGVI
ncbi:MAG: hypothetical protein ACQER6_04150 [Pseudomonadota bacterium]